ncbi:MAG TPA: helix-turn-helix transcriptional regulator [Thermoanaerobaculia bacterium]|nr:helix-turn-helix transcriptional regulator [Thermoanaerobaculia bacterium]
MNVDVRVASVAAAIGEPARARILASLLDGRARTSTELAMVAEVSPSTASVHLHRLAAESLVRVHVQGKHRYYTLHGPRVARALEALMQLAGQSRSSFVPKTPDHLRQARTCYDHIAGILGVAIHDRFKSLEWLDGYAVTARGEAQLASCGIDVDAARKLRRRFAYACLDWSERRPHIGGALGAALLNVALKKNWVRREPDDRALAITAHGRREMHARFGVTI